MFRFLDHTGDVAVELLAATREALFVEALRAFTTVLTDLESVRPRETRRVELEAETEDVLLVDFLSELLYLFEVGRFLASSAEVRLDTEVGRARLDAVVSGETYDASRHPPKLLVKAVTYHALELEDGPDGFRARLVLDI